MRELSLHVLDALQNAVEAGATRIDVRIDEDSKIDLMTIYIADNGRGMTKEMADRVLDPFVTTRKTRHVGLGLPLLAAAARRCDGNLTIQSEPGVGTHIKASFRRSHMDRAPLGDMPSALLAVLLSRQAVDVAYRHRVDDNEFEFDSSEVRRELGEVSLDHWRVRSWLLSALQEGERSLLVEKAAG